MRGHPGFRRDSGDGPYTPRYDGTKADCLLGAHGKTSTSSIQSSEAYHMQ